MGVNTQQDLYSSAVHPEGREATDLHGAAVEKHFPIPDTASWDGIAADHLATGLSNHRSVSSCNTSMLLITSVKALSPVRATLGS